MKFYTLFKMAIVYLFPAIALISLIANLISFYMFSRKRFQNTVFSIYFRVYLVFQCLNLVMPINKMFELNFGIHFSRLSNFACKLRYYYGNVNYSICSWLMVVVSLDRFLSISYPKNLHGEKSLCFK